MSVCLGPACSSTVRVNCGGGDFCYNATWTVRGDSISFEIRARTTGWAAVGFSDDMMMVMNIMPTKMTTSLCYGAQYSSFIEYIQTCYSEASASGLKPHTTTTSVI